jgi:two-component system response regulator PilR (NtrC family)
VGSQTEVAIDVRFLAATHKDLAAEVQAERFRQDLYYRINVIELAMPSLRQRPEDIPGLVDEILARLGANYHGDIPIVDTDAMTVLQAHDFPGNVRELENVVERAFTLCEDGVIQARDLNLDAPLPIDPSTPTSTHPGAQTDAGDETRLSLEPGESLEALLDNIEKQLITDALNDTRWNKTAAAKQLGITFRALRYRLKKLDLE